MSEWKNESEVGEVFDGVWGPRLAPRKRRFRVEGGRVRRSDQLRGGVRETIRQEGEKGMSD